MANHTLLKTWTVRVLGALRRHWVRTMAVTALVFTVAMSLLTGIEPIHARDVGTGREVENTYALMVSTGSSPGRQVEFFGITYDDENGNSRTEYVFTRRGKNYPGSAEMGYRLGRNLVPKGDRYGDERSDFKSNFSYDLASESGAEESLRPNTTDTFLFQPAVPIKTVTGISFFGAQGALHGQWYCGGIRVYRVDKLFGYTPMGGFSNQRFADFQGTLLARTKKIVTQPFSWTKDKMFHSNPQSAKTLSTFTIQNTFTPQEAAYDSTKQTEYFFELAFDDSYGAGIETLLNTSKDITLLNMGLYNALALEVQYVDLSGDTQKVTMPVIQNAVQWAIKNGVPGNSVVNGIAQQGESLGFVGILPDCKSIEKYRIVYGYKKAGLETGLGSIISYDSSPLSRYGLHQKRVTLQQDDLKPDTIVVSHLAVYDMSKSQITAAVKGGRLDLTKTGDPVRVAPRVRANIAPGGVAEGSFEDYDSTKELATNDYQNSYLVTIKTDAMPSAGTTADIRIRFQYTNTNNSSSTSQQYSLKEISRDYYGQVNLEGTDVMYLHQLLPGNEMKFVITLKDVARFTSFDVEMGTEVNDDWQMQSLTIEKITQLGKRATTMEERTSNVTDADNKTLTLDRTVTRDNVCIPKANTHPENGSILLQPGESVNGSLDINAAVPGEKPEEEWNGERFQMTYEEALREQGYAKARYTYLVTVNVANDEVTSTSDGDCGSKNLFYFQLVFKNGTSAYVLANQQLASDGFRPGVAEQFTIAVNQNYGEVASVNIIPDVETSDSEMYDKLKIDNITVSRAGTGGVSKQWIVSNVGWVAFEFKDEGEAQKTGLSTPRKETDLASSYPISYSTYVVNLQFCVTTGEYQVEEGTGKMPPQFEGALLATIQYYNGSGEYKTYSFDVVQAMYLYAKKQPRFLGADENDKKLVGDKAVSDPNYMFRHNQASRFIVGIDDISELVSITLHPTGTVATVLPIKSITASLIDSDGPLMLNKNNEYERRNKTTPAAATVDYSEPHRLLVLAGQQTETILNFEENKISISKLDGGNIESSVDRVPPSTNDTLNVYLVPKGEGLEMGKYKVDCTMQYATKYGAMHQTSLLTMTPDAKNTVLYATGISASNMTDLKLLILNARKTGDEDVNNFLDYAVVQQVRSGVVINTFFVKMSESSSAVEQSYAIKGRNGIDEQAQVVELKLKQGISETYLVKESYDIMLSLGYTSRLMPDGTVLQSPKIFLTDQQISALAAGNTVRITFNQYYVKDIQSLTLRGTGGQVLPVETACVGVYPLVGGKPGKCTSWTSFPTGGTIGREDTTLQGKIAMEGDHVLRTLELTFADESGRRVNANMSKSPVRMVVNYLNTAGRVVELTYDDVRTHQSRVNDGTQPLAVSVMLPGLEKLRTVYLEVHDDNADATPEWYVPMVYMRMAGPNETLERNFTINKTFKEGERAYLNVGNLGVRVSGQTYNQETSEFTQLNATSNDKEPTINLLTKSEQSVKFVVEKINSTSDLVTKVERVVGSSTASATALLQGDQKDLTFQTPINDTDENAVYRVTISLSELPHLSVVVNITVLPGPKKPAVDPEKPAEGGTTPGETKPPDKEKPTEGGGASGETTPPGKEESSTNPGTPTTPTTPDTPNPGGQAQPGTDQTKP